MLCLTNYISEIVLSIINHNYRNYKKKISIIIQVIFMKKYKIYSLFQTLKKKKTRTLFSKEREARLRIRDAFSMISGLLIVGKAHKRPLYEKKSVLCQSGIDYSLVFTDRRVVRRPPIRLITQCYLTGHSPTNEASIGWKTKRFCFP